MLNRSASLPMFTRVLKALPGKLDIKRHLPIILSAKSEDYVIVCYKVIRDLELIDYLCINPILRIGLIHT